MQTNSARQARQWTILAVLLALYAVTSFNRAATGIIAPILQHDIGLNDRQLTTVVTSLFFANVIFQIPAGTSVDYFGTRSSISAFLFIGGLGCFWFSLAKDLNDLTAARVLMGIGYCVIQPAAYMLFARFFPADRFATLVGFLIAAGSIGGLLGTLPLAVLVSGIGWRHVYLAIAAVTMFLAVLSYSVIEEEDTKGKSVEARTPRAAAGILSVLRIRQFILILPLALVSFAPLTAITALWGASYLDRVFGYATRTQGLSLFAVFLAAVAGSMIFGRLDRRFKTYKWVVVFGATVSTTCFLILALWPISYAPIAIALLAIMSLAQQFGVTLSAHMRSIVPIESVGRATAIYTLVSILGIPLMQWLFGSVLTLAQRVNLPIDESFRVAFGAVAVCVALATTVYLRVDDRSPTRE